MSQLLSASVIIPTLAWAAIFATIGGSRRLSLHFLSVLALALVCAFFGVGADAINAAIPDAIHVIAAQSPDAIQLNSGRAAYILMVTAGLVLGTGYRVVCWLYGINVLAD
ncbi:hypothetical protein K8R03_02250 [Candidatus Kaiserbacteria bacterium]|nr:hypothetical protein [Candidatus Kaiserbacteria bacterium]